MSQNSYRPPRVFVSHATADTGWCAKFVACLRAYGLDVWWDTDGLNAGLLATQIEHELQARSVFVPVLSPHIYETETPEKRYRPWLETEYNTAMSLYHRQRDERVTIPVVASRCDIPPFFDAFVGARGEKASTPADAADEVLRLLGQRMQTKEPWRMQVPNRYEDAVILGQSLLTQGRAKESLAIFEGLQRREKRKRSKLREGAAWLGIGLALDDLERFEDALMAYNRAIELVSNEARGWAGRGSLLGQLGRYNEGLSDLEKATTLDAEYQAAWLNRSTVLRHLGRYQESLDAATTGVELAPGYGPAYAVQSRAFEALKRFDEALAALEKALGPDTSAVSRVRPKQWKVLALTAKARLLMERGLLATALALLEQALDIDPQYGPAWHGKGGVCFRQGRYKEALFAFERSVEVQEEDSKVPGLAENKDLNLSMSWEGQGFTLIWLKRYEEAHIAFDKALATQPWRSTTLSGLGELFRAEGKHREALNSFRTAAELGDGDIGEAWNNAGAALMALGRFDDSLSFFDKAIVASGGRTPRPWLNKIGALMQLQRPDRAQVVRDEMRKNLADVVIAPVSP